MYASIRRYRIDRSAIGEITARARDGFLPIISQLPGFIAYYVVDQGDGNAATISLFQDKAAAEESNRAAAGWVQENMVSLVEGPPEILAGRVVVSSS